MELHYHIPISLKHLVSKQLQDVKSGRVSKEQAEKIIKRTYRYSSKTRQDIVAHLTERYDQQTAEAFQFFSLI